MSSRQGRRPRALIILTVFLVILAVGVYLFTRDDPPPEDAHLRIAYENIPDDENAFTYFHEAAEAVDWPEDGEEKRRAKALLDEDGWDEAFATELLARNEGVLGLMERGLACPRFQVPEITEYTARFPYLLPWRDIARLGAIRAELLFTQGKEREAFEQAIQVTRFGRRIQEGHGDILHYVNGMVIKHRGLRRFRDMLGRTTLDATSLTPYIVQLNEYGASAHGLAEAFRLDYTLATTFVDDVAHGEIPGKERKRVYPSRLVFKPNRTKRMFASAFGTCMQNASRTYADSDFPSTTRDPCGWRCTVKAMLSGNYVGKSIYYMLMPSVRKIQASKCRENCLIAATQIMIALKCYSIEHGDLPNTLDELVPDYFDALPVDDFDGKPMKYSKEQRVVYAVGTDLADNGGIAERDKEGVIADGYDVVYKITF